MKTDKQEIISKLAELEKNATIIRLYIEGGSESALESWDEYLQPYIATTSKAVRALKGVAVEIFQDTNRGS